MRYNGGAAQGNQNDRKIRRLQVCFLICGTLLIFLALWIAITWPVDPIYPAYQEIAEQLIRREPIGNFYPIGYPFLISGWLWGSVTPTLRAVHLISLLATWAIATLVILSVAKDAETDIGEMPARLAIWSAFWCLAFFLNPYFFLGLVRESDSEVDTLLMTVLVAWAVGAAHAKPWTWIAAGLALGLFVAVRPNAISLVFALGAITWLIRAPLTLPFAMAAACLSVIAIINVSTVGRPFYLPSNGGYNLFAGNNPFSFAWLVQNYNAEFSLDEAIKWCGLSSMTRFTVPSADYLHCTVKFIVGNPEEVLRLMVYKTYTMMFRPNLRLAGDAFKATGQYMVLLPAGVWWVAFFGWRTFRQSFAAKVGLLFVVSYAVPFILTNADPRFRIPIEVIYAITALAFTVGDSASSKSQSKF
jgi:hypothetical protein